MIWAVGDLVDVANVEGRDIAFTANGVVRNGRLVMGAGAAKRVRDAFPGVDARFGSALQGADTPYHIASVNWGARFIWAVQVKRHYNDHLDPVTKEACVSLMETSLDHLASEAAGERLVLNCPLIGLGGFSLDRIRPIVEGRLAALDVVVLTT